ncbi:ABC transporter ATP-binding protein [Corynebacterium lubricantis]|uniref:ABC transporter ATP-binding protein n=1 Tax=Corynebacterium lubricantis TaxID=541095 RepID=UPI0003807553|nr:ABC transporter ATP-binding protein [Corynebacterium lubricantis]
MAIVISATELQKRFGNHVAVNGIDLAVEQGSIYGLVGPNGAGKTTILRMLVDILRPSDGTLSVLGATPRESGSELRRRIGYLPGELKLNERVTGKKLLRQLERISGSVDQEFVEKLAKRFDVDLARPVRTLSKGNKQKIGLIQAFMHRPELLILDEPTSGLDPLMQREFLALVREAQDNGQTVLLSSHILSEIQHAADEVAVLSHGKIVAHNDVNSLRLAGVSHVRAILGGASLDEARDRLEALPELSKVYVARTTGDLVSVSAALKGEVDPVIKALAGFHVVNLSIEEPDLEESILNLYERGEVER